MAQRLNAVEDAVASVRSEIGRGSEQQHTVVQSHASKIDDLDEKMFALDKELLKLKLALPASVKAQIPAFTDQRYDSASVHRVDASQSGELCVTLKLQELATDLEAVKADSQAYRSADRKQFDALTNRMREAARSHHALKKELEGRLHDMSVCCDQVGAKNYKHLPMEFT
jgi:predicted  nucleic acid-binding Zn-ribbon protein